jgi:hypothetical protein
VVRYGDGLQFAEILSRDLEKNWYEVFLTFVGSPSATFLFNATFSYGFCLDYLSFKGGFGCC